MKPAPPCHACQTTEGHVRVMVLCGREERLYCVACSGVRAVDPPPPRPVSPPPRAPMDVLAGRAAQSGRQLRMARPCGEPWVYDDVAVTCQRERGHEGAHQARDERGEAWECAETRNHGGKTR